MLSVMCQSVFLTKQYCHAHIACLKHGAQRDEIQMEINDDDDRQTQQLNAQHPTRMLLSRLQETNAVSII